MNNRDTLIISILTFITIIAWIFFDAYHTYTNSTIPPDVAAQMEPLNINITTEDLNKLKNRMDFFPVTITPTPITASNSALNR